MRNLNNSGQYFHFGSVVKNLAQLYIKQNIGRAGEDIQIVDSNEPNKFAYLLLWYNIIIAYTCSFGLYEKFVAPGLPLINEMWI